MKNELNHQYGKLLVIKKYNELSNNREVQWICLCTCGNTTIVIGSSLRRGNTTSCGCIRRLLPDFQTTDSEYLCWKHMIDRCYRPSTENYNNYGGRGIKVCNRWRNNVLNFLNDMGRKPGKEYSIERIDNNGNYEPSNCIWATQSQQANNRRRR